MKRGEMKAGIFMLQRFCSFLMDTHSKPRLPHFSSLPPPRRWPTSCIMPVHTAWSSSTSSAEPPQLLTVWP